METITQQTLSLLASKSPSAAYEACNNGEQMLWLLRRTNPDHPQLPFLEALSKQLDNERYRTPFALHRQAIAAKKQNSLTLANKVRELVPFTEWNL